MTTPVTLTSPSASTQLYTASAVSLGSLPVAANEPVPGAFYRVEAFGSISVTAAGSYALTFSLMWGGLSGTTINSVTTGTISNSGIYTWTVDGTVNFVTPNSDNPAYFYDMLNVTVFAPDTDGPGTNVVFSDTGRAYPESFTTDSVIATSATSLDLVAQWGSSGYTYGAIKGLYMNRVA